MIESFDWLTEILPADGWQRLMVDAFWQSTLIAALALSITRWCIRQPAARGWVVLVAMTACLFLPATSWLIRSAGWGLGNGGQTAAISLSIGSETTASRLAPPTSTPIARADGARGGIRQTTGAAVPAESARRSSGAGLLSRFPPSGSVLRTIGVVWLGTSLFLLVHLITSAFAVARLIRDARVCGDPRLTDLLPEVSREVGLRATPRLLVSDRIAAPMVLAYFRPSLLVPDVNLFGPEQANASTLFAHELAHVRRGDGWSRLWVRLVLIALPLNPMVWRLRREFSDACEEACDDWAVAAGNDPVDVAATLTAWAGVGGNRRELVWAAGVSSTRSRVTRLLAMSGPPNVLLSPRWRIATILVVLAFCGGLSVAQSNGHTEAQAERPAATSQVPEQLAGHTASVEGRVLLEESGLPAVGAQVEFWNDTVAMDSRTRSTTDKEGRYRVENLPPGDYRVGIQSKDRVSLFIPKFGLRPGINRRDFSVGRGGLLKGRVVDVRTEQPIALGQDEAMDIGEMNEQRRWFAGMPTTAIRRDGTFQLRLPAGKRLLGMYFGPKWQGVNTDRLARHGVEIVDGETKEIEIRVKPRESRLPPQALSQSKTAQLAEKAAVAAINELGGWVELESIDGAEHVVEVNMVFHEDDATGRQENRLISDECLFYMKKFPHLKRLLLYREQATDAGLAQLHGLDQLEAIYLWDASAVGDVGARHLAKLQSLRVIHVSNAALTDASLESFAGLPQIAELSLQGNRFTDKGLAALKDANQLRVLVLGLGETHITDEGLRSLSGLTELRTLGLQNTQISDEGIRHLRPLQKLERLWTSGSNLSEVGREELHRTFPNLR